MLRPYSLINTQGKPYLGHFAQPVNEINVEDADYRTPLNKKAGRWKKHFNFKRFQYFGAMSDKLIFGCALADLRYLGAAFVYVFRPEDKAMRTWQFKLPFSWGLDMTNRPDNGVSTMQKGARKIAMGYTLNSAGERRKTLQVDFGPELQIDAAMFEPADYQSMALCTPCNINGWVYAQKTAALPVTGTVVSELGKHALDQIQTHGHHDFSSGFMRRQTFWNWACFSGLSGKQRLGLNVSWGVNETGFSENCFWVNDQVQRLPQVIFKFNRDDETSSWRITSDDGRVDLAFTPQGLHREQLNVLFMATYFKQIFGQFKGHLTNEKGQRFEVENLYGFVEDHFSKW